MASRVGRVWRHGPMGWPSTASQLATAQNGNAEHLAGQELLDQAIAHAGQGPTYLVQVPAENTVDSSDQDVTPCSVRYRAVFYDWEGTHIRTVDNDREPTRLQEVSRELPLVFEVVTEYTCSEIDPLSTDFDTAPEERLLPVTSLRGAQRLDIHSPAILQALRHVVQRWPKIDLTSQSVRLYEPFSILVHHLEVLDRYKRIRAPEEASEICQKAVDVHKHLTLLQSHMASNVMPEILEERERHKRGFATYEHLWLLFPPGVEVVVPMKNARDLAPYLRGFLVESMVRDSGSNEKTILYLSGLDFDGSSIGRIYHSCHIQAFEGEVEVTCLDVIPAGWPGHVIGGKPVAQQLRTNGQRAFELLEPRCLQHRGRVVVFPFKEVNGLVMVDMRTFYIENPEERPVLSHTTSYSQLKQEKSDCVCPSCKERTEEFRTLRQTSTSGIDSIPVEGGKLTKQQQFLYPTRVFGFHFQSRSWELVDVANLSPAQYRKDVLDTLVMAPERLKIIKALCRIHSQNAVAAWSADFVEPKGKSQITLLHGRPGVGKTYTAECIAEYVARPLLRLTSAEIGLDPHVIDENLTYHFALARRWKALVLIDEADSYLERRYSNDSNRNALVLNFRSVLEAFEGEVFLITDRVGAFDDAFNSRIHVKLYFPALLDMDRQKIWTASINRLSKERQKEIRVTLGAKEFIKGPKIKSLDLNGREIRNAFQTAVALAEYEQNLDEEGKIMVEDHHIDQVAEMSRDFQVYLDELHHGDEDKRAARSFERHDVWTSLRSSSQ